LAPFLKFFDPRVAAVVGGKCFVPFDEAEALILAAARDG